MDASSYPRGSRGRGNLTHDAARGRPHSRNKHWSAADSVVRTNTPNHSDSERWERGGHRGGGRGRGALRGVAPIFHNVSLRLNHPPHSPQPQRTPVVRQPVHLPEAHEDVEIEEPQGEEDELYDEDDEIEPEAEAYSGSFAEIHEPELDSPEEREKFYQEVRAVSTGAPSFSTPSVAGEGTRTRKEDSDSGREDGRSFGAQTPGGCDIHCGHMHGYVPSFRTIQA